MSELEDRLRTMLRERAVDVTQVPPHVLALPDVRPHANRRAAWLVAAAVAIVLAVAAAVVAVSGDRDRSTPPATRLPSPSVTAAPTLQRTCTATLPGAWKAALTGGTSTYGAWSAMPLAVSADGRQSLIARDFRTSRDVALVDERGHARRIYSVPQSDEYQVTDATMEGGHAALDLDRLPRNSNGVDPTVHEIVLVDLRSGSTKILDHTSRHAEITGGRTIDSSALWQGKVYWDVRQAYPSRTRTIYAYDVADGTRTMVVNDATSGPRLLPGGLTWGDYGTAQVTLPGTTPPGVPMATSLRTDGTSYAWAQRHAIAWTRTGAKQPKLFALPVPGRNPTVMIDAVGGPFVLADIEVGSSQRSWLLDTRTGATALATGFAYVLAGSGHWLTYQFINGGKDRLTVQRIDTTTLPELRC